MRYQAPFFPGFQRHLFGRPPISVLQRVERQRHQIEATCLSQLATVFGSFLRVSLLEFKASSGTNSRGRVYTPAVTFWAFLGQVIDVGSSCRKTVSNVQALFAARGMALPCPETKAYCSARLRLPVRLLRGVLDDIAGHLCSCGRRDGGRTLVVDGSAITMPDTPANQAKYPQHGSQRLGCGFPIMKIVGLFCLDSGAWIACAKSHFRVHESRLLWRLFRHLRKGDTLITDRGFCSYWVSAELMRRGVNFVMRNHQKRKSDFRRGTRLGQADHLVTWERPQRPGWMSKIQYDAMPRELVLRETRLRTGRKGFRTTEIIVVTSFLAPERKSAEELGDYFLRRWQVELYFDDIKTSMGMDVLRTKSPALICRELLMHMIAYNLIRAQVLRSGADVRRVSFKGTVDRITSWAWIIWASPTRKRAGKLVAALLENIAADLVIHRPGRREPRVLKRRVRSYQYLSKPRHEMVEIPHRSKYRATA